MHMECVESWDIQSQPANSKDILMWAQTQASCEHLWATVIAGIACQHIALLRSQIHLLFVDIHHAMFSGCISTFFHWLRSMSSPLRFLRYWLDTSHISLNFDDYDGFDNGLNWEWVNPVRTHWDHLLVNIHLAATWCEDQGTRSTKVLPTSIHLQYAKLRPRLKEKP